MSVRTFPKRRHKNRGDGWCTWCGLEVAKPRRTWHEECFRRYQLHTDPGVQRHHVARRDGEKCWDCDAIPMKWLVSSYDRSCGTVRWGGPPEYVGAYCSLERVVALELEHEVPLWKVAAFGSRRRRWFFGPWNLRLRCPDCHKAKSKRESAERAAIKRAAVQA